MRLSIAFLLVLASTAKCLLNTGMAASVTIPASADTSLFEDKPTFNLGNLDDLPAGTTKNGFKGRMLIQFQPDLAIPPGSIVTSASLILHVEKDPKSPQPSVFELRRILIDWEEGIQSGPQGATADNGEPSWSHRSAPSTTWSSPGGSIGTDFSNDISGTFAMSGIGNYSFPDNSQLVADVQNFLDNPTSNFGWVIMTQSEEIPSTSRRITTREGSADVPSLIVTYTLPPGWITDVTAGSSSLDITWQGGAPPYQLQNTANIAPPFWVNLGPSVSSTTANVLKNGSQQFYRVVPDYTASYTLTFNSVWTPSTHPDNYPAGAHWSGLIGGMHNSEVEFWKIGELASTGVKNVAESGSKSSMSSEVSAAITAGTAGSIVSGGGNSASGTVQTSFSVNKHYPLTTVITMIAPSPDWFAGVAGLSLLDENGNWQDSIVVSLDLYDAGTDDGASYSSGNAVSNPEQPVSRITGFPALVGETRVPFGTFTFRRIPQ
ncbi:spondin domain-containing protein [Verrucomicrobia bacterium]|nr:spondin domain-containing protein [Verrucomicrobiota bacterium]